MIGKTLGHYEITDKLGQGGMGEVWRARDSKLGREVAIKTLPEEFAKDEERLARFEREAKLLASLNHLNVATIHGLEEHEGTRFLVLELVEGDTLADRLKRGAIPVEESLKLALQIAEALEAAHEKRVIHRDLKPANIKVTPDGKVKVLDFGLAKAFAGDGTDANLSQSPTLSLAETQQGIILGTAAYMSPEQARGVTVDKRADIWAFGCVLYEMITGRQVFQGELMSDVMASVLKSDPDYEGLPPTIRPKLRELLRRCLEKDPKQRWHDVGDVRIELEQVEADSEGAVMMPSPDGRLEHSLPWIAVTFVVTALVVSVASWSFLAGRANSTGAKVCYGRGGTTPETTWLCLPMVNSWYTRQTISCICVRWVKSRRHPFLTQKEVSLLSFRQTVTGWLSLPRPSLKKVRLAGGPPVPLGDFQEGYAGSWGELDQIVFGVSGRGGLFKVSANGGTPEPVCRVGRLLGSGLARGTTRWGVGTLYCRRRPGDQHSRSTVIGWRSSGSFSMAVGTPDMRRPVISSTVKVTVCLLWVLISDRLQTIGSAVPVVENVYAPGARRFPVRARR